MQKASRKLRKIIITYFIFKCEPIELILILIFYNTHKFFSINIFLLTQVSLEMLGFRVSIMYTEKTFKKCLLNLFKIMNIVVMENNIPI